LSFFGAFLEWTPSTLPAFAPSFDKEMAAGVRDDEIALFRHVHQFANGSLLKCIRFGLA